MPDTQPPHFGFFTERDTGDETDPEYTVPGLPALQYPHEPERFTRAGEDAAAWKAAYHRLLDEYEKQMAQLEQLRAEFRRIYPPLPVFMQERLEGLRVLLGVER